MALMTVLGIVDLLHGQVQSIRPPVSPPMRNGAMFPSGGGSKDNVHGGGTARTHRGRHDDRHVEHNISPLKIWETFHRNTLPNSELNPSVGALLGMIWDRYPREAR